MRAIGAAVQSQDDAAWLAAMARGSGGRTWLEAAVSKLLTLQSRPAAAAAPARDLALLPRVRSSPLQPLRRSGACACVPVLRGPGLPRVQRGAARCCRRERSCLSRCSALMTCVLVACDRILLL